MTKFALIGRGISYSLSKSLHEGMFALKNIKDAHYDIVDAGDKSLDEVVALMRSEYAGFNVTKPFKVDIMSYLDEIDDMAKAIGSVNTVVNKGGKLIGYNTDIDGIISTFAHDNVSAKGKRCLMIGYGGVARTVAYALHEMGAQSIAVTGRNVDKMTAFVEGIKDFDITIDANVTESYDIVVNATSVGTDDMSATPIDVCRVRDIEYYFDLIYSPRRTLIITKLEEMGVKCRNGLYMLAYQAGKADEKYLDLSISDNDILRVYFDLAGETFRRKLKNGGFERILVVGFMGAGKTTIGNYLSHILKMRFLDTDFTVEKRCLSIQDMFASGGGEDEFRSIESEVLDEVLDEDNAVISTGGGIVMLDYNMRRMKNSKDTFIVYIDVEFDELARRVKGSNRPLFQDVDKARELYNYRRSRYEDIADITANGNTSKIGVLEDILFLEDNIK